jgi:peptide/nickel transport system ATP-binding protein
MTAVEYEAERVIVGDLSALDTIATTFRLEAPAGRSGDELLSFLEKVRSDDPDEPFWRGVRRLSAEGSHVDVELSDPYPPRLRPVERVQVECNLFDDEALRQAEALRVSAT